MSFVFYNLQSLNSLPLTTHNDDNGDEPPAANQFPALANSYAAACGDKVADHA